jgi:putative membrane-bound dehydrogenase-like protein
MTLILLTNIVAAADRPTIADPRLVIELVAAEPDIVTPTGLAVDEHGAIWVLENHTHHRPPNYTGPASDRVRVFSDFGPDGKALRVTTAAQGFRNSMGLTFGPDGSLFLATRSDIYRLRFEGTTEIERRVVARLETTGDYPHNGLAGFAVDPLGWVYFGLGENLGVPYRLVGSAGDSLSGGGEGGSVYRIRPDGTGLQRIATGFWNPFHMAFDAYGRLFVVDNDPDSRGPCRLLHIVTGGDYGYRFRYGRKGLHPFTCWNGELPGTLPMVAGTAEAPSGIIAYESDGLPSDYVGSLLTTSWGDHVIERFDLVPRGASIGASAKVLVRGTENFRPVGIIAAPDGSLIVSDWVDKSYPVHGKGRIWRIRAKGASKGHISRFAIPTCDSATLARWLSHPRVEIRHDAALTLASRGSEGRQRLRDAVQTADNPRTQLAGVWGARRGGVESFDEILKLARQSKFAEVRAVAAELGEASRSLSELKAEPAEVRLRAIPHCTDPEALLAYVDDADPFLQWAAIQALGRPAFIDFLTAKATTRATVGLLLCLRQTADPKARAAIPRLLASQEPQIRRAAIQWAAEERITDLAKDVEAAGTSVPITREVVEAWLVAREMLSGKPRDPKNEIAGEDYVAPLVADSKRDPALRGLALRMIRHDHPQLSTPVLKDLFSRGNDAIRRDVVRVLALRADEASQSWLRELAQRRDESQLWAVVGLASSAEQASTREILRKLLDDPMLRGEARRSLGVLDDEPGQRPANPAAWKAALGQAAGNAVAGERVFFRPNGPRCYACHTVDGRGHAFGPDLSAIGRSLSREKLVESVLEPSKEVAPAFTTWKITTTDGKDHIGQIVDEGAHSIITLIDSQGRVEKIHRKVIDERSALRMSIMPDNLTSLMTVREFRDLIAFLASRR